MFIIDFDDTLFDTQNFKKELAYSLKNIGVDEKLFWQTYKEARMLPDRNFSYSFERHADILEKKNFNKKQILENLNEVKSKIKKFLFPDTKIFLEYLQSFHQELHLLSLGDKDFQEIKVNNCEIEKYFDSVVELKTFDYKYINGKSARKIICYYAKNYKGQNR